MTVRRATFPLVFLFALTSFAGFSQDYMQTIASQACDCLSEIQGDYSKDELTTKMGMCLITAASPYSDNLKKDHKIDITKSKDAKKMGEMIAYAMAGECPNLLIAAAGQGDFEEARSEYLADKKPSKSRAMDEDSYEVRGKITGIADEGFAVCSLEQADGTITKLAWIEGFDGDDQLSGDWEAVKGRKATVEFAIKQIYDAKSKSYIKRKVIRSVAFE